MSKNADFLGDGGPYFPQTVDSWCGAEGNSPVPHGASLRDRFAIAALPAVIEVIQQIEQQVSISSNEGMAVIADIAWGLADAMLRARDK